MLVISSNLTTRDSRINRIFNTAHEWKVDEVVAKALQEIAKQCLDAGADVLEINTQQHHDHPDAMKFAIKAIQKVAKCRFCLSSNNVETIKAGLKTCKQLPMVNYISFEEERLKEMLPAIAYASADVVLLVSDPASPTDAEEMLEKAAILVGAANEAGITNGQIFIDPGLIHVTSAIGQRHMVEVMKFLKALPEVFDPLVGSTCWLGNASAGGGSKVRTVIESSLLPMLAGAGLTSVFMDVLKKDNMRALQMIKVFKNQTVYSDSSIEPVAVA